MLRGVSQLPTLCEERCRVRISTPAPERDALARSGVEDDADGFGTGGFAVFPPLFGDGLSAHAIRVEADLGLASVHDS